MTTPFVYVAAAAAEIAGEYALGMAPARQVDDLGRARPRLPGGVRVALTLVHSAAAGRAYAAYGGFYIVASLIWLWSIEGLRPDRWDAIGAAICLLGASVILFGPRPA